MNYSLEFMMDAQKPSRKDFLNILLGGAGALAALELSFVGLRYFSPRVAEGEFGSVFNLEAPTSTLLGV